FSHDGSFFLYRTGRDTVVVVDSETRQKRYTLAGHADYIMEAATSPDDSMILTFARDQSVRIWNATDGQELRVLVESGNQYLSGWFFSPDGRLIALDAQDSEVQVREIESGGLLHVFRISEDPVRRVELAFSPEGSFLAAGNDKGTLKVFDLVSG
ncbi:WD40 repeat-like protein, partial [Dendrothele bispora CBS 962.96]